MESQIPPVLINTNTDTHEENQDGTNVGRLSGTYNSGGSDSADEGANNHQVMNDSAGEDRTTSPVDSTSLLSSNSSSNTDQDKLIEPPLPSIPISIPSSQSPQSTSTTSPSPSSSYSSPPSNHHSSLPNPPPRNQRMTFSSSDPPPTLPLSTLDNLDFEQKRALFTKPDSLSSIARNLASKSNRTRSQNSAVDKDTRTISPRSSSISNPNFRASASLRVIETIWKLIPASGRPYPPPLSHQSCVYFKDTLYMIGGARTDASLQYSDEIYSIDLGGLSKTDDPSSSSNIKNRRASIRGFEWSLINSRGIKLPQISGHTATLAPTDKIYIVGGHNALETFKEIWVFDVSTSVISEYEFAKESMIQRCNHTATLFHAKGNRGTNSIFLFGGSSNRGKDYILHIQHLDLQNNSLKRLEALESALIQLDPAYADGIQGHSASIVGQKIYFFGGRSSTGFFSNILVLDVKLWRWSILESTGNIPPPRQFHAAFVAADQKHIGVFGGRGHERMSLDNLYVLDLESNRWRLFSFLGITARFGHCIVPICSSLQKSIDGDVLLLGGQTNEDLSLIMICVEKTLNAGGSLSFSSAAAAAAVSFHPPIASPPPLAVQQQQRGSRVSSNPQMGKVSASSISSVLESVPSTVISIPASASASASTSAFSPKIDQTASSRLSRKEVLEHCITVDDFTSKLTEELLKFLQSVSSELQQSNPFSNPEVCEQTASQVLELQQLCFSKPSKMSIPLEKVKDAPSRRFTILSSAPKEKELEKEKEKEKEKVPFPRQYYEQLVLPPKRKQVEMPAPKDGIESEESRDLRLRDGVFNEILTTETDYVRDLGVLIGLYLLPLKNEFAGLVSEFHLSRLFKNVDVLFEVNSRLLKQLEEEAEKPPIEQSIGKVFLNASQELLQYSNYCTNQVSSEEIVQQQLRENQRFAEFAADVHKMEESHSLEIQSFLMKPFQRICRYPLLLKELMKRTPNSWPDYASVVSAVQAIDAIMKDANETQRVTDSMLKIIDLKDRLVGIDDAQELKLLHKFHLLDDIDIKIIDKNHASKGHAFLFTELLLVVKVKGGKYFKRNLIPISQVYVFETTNKNAKFSFEVVRKDKQERVIISFSSNELKEKWSSRLNGLAFKNAISGK